MIFHQIWSESKPKSAFFTKYSMLIISSLSILLCMTFSFHEVGGIYFDLRRIPFWFGILYGGPITGLFLCALTILVRLFQNGVGLWISISITIILYLLTLYLRPLYIRLSTKNKIVLGTVVNIAFSVIFLVSTSIYQKTLYSPDLWIEYIVLNAIGIVLASYVLEMINRNYLMRMQIAHSEKLELLSDLAASVNHEIKNPLTTSRGLIQLIKEDHSLPKEKKEYFFQLALDEIDKVDKIVTDYLAFARPYTDVAEKFQMKDVFSQAIEIISPLASKTMVSVRVVNIPDCFIQGSNQHFLQALVHILKNSVKASSEGGLVEVNAQLDHDWCFITIKDNGNGIDQDLLGRLGEPYFTTNSHGTGLGMMVVYRVIENMNGKIMINSKKGTGTEVHITLPMI